MVFSTHGCDFLVSPSFSRLFAMPSSGLVWLQVANDVPAIYEEDRVPCIEWLASVEFPKTDKQWDAVKENWKEFLTATLPPSRKSMVTASYRQRRLIQGAFWELVDGLESLSERWPAKARVALNRHANGGQKGKAFESLAARWMLEKRRRFQSMWTGMVCFLVYSSQTKGRLAKMGLTLSGKQKTQLSRVAMISSSAIPGAGINIGTAVKEFMLATMTIDGTSTVRNNAALWWTAVLVRSAVSEVEGGGKEEDFIGRGRFTSNILPLDLNIRDRVEAMEHYSKVLILDKAFKEWATKSKINWVAAVQSDLNEIDNEWLNAENGPRPDSKLDKRECSSEAWVKVIQHLEEEASRFLGGNQGTFTQQVGRLQERLKREGRARKRQRVCEGEQEESGGEDDGQKRLRN